MANTTSNPLFRAMIWAKELYREALTENWFAKKGLMGKGENSIVQSKSDLSNKKGERVRIECDLVRKRCSLKSVQAELRKDVVAVSFP
jgi:hypothetical protein